MSRDVAFAAGLWEGEGCFTVSRRWTTSGARPSLVAQISMADEDVITWFRDSFAPGRKVDFHTARSPTQRPIYRVRLYGQPAEDLALLLRPYLFERRRAKIDELLALDLAHRPRSQAVD